MITQLRTHCQKFLATPLCCAPVCMFIPGCATVLYPVCMVLMYNIRVKQGTLKKVLCSIICSYYLNSTTNDYGYTRARPMSVIQYAAEHGSLTQWWLTFDRDSFSMCWGCLLVRRKWAASQPIQDGSSSVFFYLFSSLINILWKPNCSTLPRVNMCLFTFGGPMGNPGKPGKSH